MNEKLIAIDTVGLLTYLVNKHTQKIERIFEEVEDSNIKLLVPSIVIGEMIYILLKGKEVFGEKVEKAKIQLILNTLFENPSFIIKDLTYEGWKIFLELSIPKLHDRIMVAICKQEQVTAIITKDEEIIKSSLLETIW